MSGASTDAMATGRLAGVAWWPVVWAGLLLGGCSVGPDFTKPPAPHVTTYTAKPLASTTAVPQVAGGASQHFAQGTDVAAQWWTLFHSPALSAQVEQALAHNPDLEAARAALAAARETVRAQRGSYFPSIGASVGANRVHDPAAALAPVPSTNAYRYTLYTGQVDVSYAPDVFGRNGRTVESLQAQAQAIRFQAIATWNTLAANVVVAAIQEAALDARIKAARKLVEVNSQALDIVKYQFAKGYVSELAVAAQASQLAQAKVALPDLVKQMTQQENLLAVLTGRFPGQASLPTFDFSMLDLPQSLPVSLPSRLVAQRPDVRQAQANLHAASAEIGIAAANRLPNIQLTADAGAMALAIGKLFTSGTGFGGLAAAIAAPIFQGGALTHQERAAKASYRQAAAQYRGTVLKAFQDVSNTLTALAQDAKTLEAAAAAADASQTTLDLSQLQFRNGYASELDLLNAEQAWQQSHASLVDAQAARYADTAALFQALGGGWWHEASLAPPDPSLNRVTSLGTPAATPRQPTQ